MGGWSEASAYAPQFFSLGQCLLSFIQCSLASIQFGFPLGELLFGGRILFLAGANHRQGNKHGEDKEFFHIGDSIFRFPLIRTNKPKGRVLVK